MGKQPCLVPINGFNLKNNLQLLLIQTIHIEV